MQKLFYILIPFVLICCWSCDEIPPDVSAPSGGGGSNPTINVDDQRRQVLIEEFTGVRCINCPEGSIAIENLLDTYQEQLVAISIHSGFFSPPYSQSQFDFQTDDGDNLLNYLGQPLGFPTAVVNRKQFSSDELQIGKSAWAGAIANELLEAPKVKIGVEHTWNESNRQIDMDITLFVEETIDATNDPRLTIMITESGVVDHQLTPSSSPDTDAEYIHKHILRDIVTNFDGDAIVEPLTAGAEISGRATYNLSADWNADNCEIVVLVNQNGLNKEVLQATQVHVVE